MNVSIPDGNRVFVFSEEKYKEYQETFARFQDVFNMARCGYRSLNAEELRSLTITEVEASAKAVSNFFTSGDMGVMLNLLGEIFIEDVPEFGIPTDEEIEKERE